jgi:hypothetical protein
MQTISFIEISISIEAGKLLGGKHEVFFDARNHEW